jgi:hypothetical protein
MSPVRVGWPMTVAVVVLAGLGVGSFVVAVWMAAVEFSF